MTSRLPQPDPASLTDNNLQLFELAATRTGTTPLTIEMLGHAPRLLGPFLGWAGALATKATLEPRDHEIVALRISHLCNSSFEWDEHRGFALTAGLTAEEIETIRVYPQQTPGTDADRALLDATDQLHRDASVDDATYARLASHFTPSQLVEIPMVAGQYMMLSMLCGFTGIDS